MLAGNTPFQNDESVNGAQAVADALTSLAIKDDTTDQVHIQSVSSADSTCAYCGYDDHASLIKCDTCYRWFCNSASSKSSASHIITHCVTSRHSSLSVHPDSKLGDTELECYNCGSKNIFTLGFVMAKDNTVMILLCRMPCSQNKNLKWDVSNWRSLIENKKLLSWISADQKSTKSKSITLVEMRKLEDKWRHQNSSSNRKKEPEEEKKKKVKEEEEEEEEEEVIQPILTSYTNPADYYTSFVKLVSLEAEYDKKATEARAVQNLKVRWTQDRNKRYCAHFVLPTYEHNQLRINVGDSMVLLHKEVKLTGIIANLPNYKSEEIMLEIHNPQNYKGEISDLKSGFTAEFIWKGTSFQRMKIALGKLLQDKDSVSFYLFNCILGQPVPKLEINYGALPTDLNIKNFVKLNESQTFVIKNILNKPLSLIQGPPGTGKTVTSSAIIYHLLKLSKKKKILVCAPSNVAVDNLAIKLHDLGIKVVRIFSKNREEIKNRADELGLHSQIRSSAGDELKRLINIKESSNELSAEDKAKFLKLINKAELKILKDTEVVCTTCVGAGDHRLRKKNFPIVLIDESTQACEPEVVIPISKGAQQLILVGDHKQLGPIVLTNKAAKAGLKSSLFERLIHMGHVPLRLEVQYRMSPKLSEFPSNIFYNGSLQNGVTLEDRAIQNKFPWPAKDTPMMFWSQFCKEEISASGVSYVNRVEASACEKAVTRLFEEGVEPEQIGIITPYEGQRVYISQYMSMNNSSRSFASKYESVEILSIDAFQGREKDYIILSCVRSNDNQTIGFLHDRRRLNVALTRAKYGLIILGSPTGLSKHWVWNKLLFHFRKNGCLVEGTLDNLKMCNVHLPNLTTDQATEKLPLVPLGTIEKLAKNAPAPKVSKNKAVNETVNDTDENEGESSDDYEDDYKEPSKKAKFRSTIVKKKVPKEEFFSISNSSINNYQEKDGPADTTSTNDNSFLNGFMAKPTTPQHSVSYSMPRAPSAASYSAPSFATHPPQMAPGNTYLNGANIQFPNGGSPAAVNGDWYKGPSNGFNTYSNDSYNAYPYYYSNNYNNGNSTNNDSWWGTGW